MLYLKLQGPTALYLSYRGLMWATWPKTSQVCGTTTPPPGDGPGIAPPSGDSPEILPPSGDGPGYLLPCVVLSSPPQGLL